MWAALLVTAVLTAQPSTEHPRRIILDVDPGIDDAMAMLLALRSPELQIEAITVGDRDRLVDFPRVEPNTDVPILIDRERFLTMFLERLTADR